MHPEKRRGVEACVHRVFASRVMSAPEERGAVRVTPRTYATQFKKKLILKQSFSHVGFQRKRKCSSGNRILWTSGQVTEVHKIMVTTCAIFAHVFASRGDGCCRVLPGGSRCVLVGFSCALNAPPKEERATFKSRHVRKRYENCRAKRSAKKNLRRRMCSKAQVLKW